LSSSVENVLYLGHNIELVGALLNSLAIAEKQPCYHLHHLLCADKIQATLAEKKYSWFICELPVGKLAAAKIAADFPFLKTTYLAAFTCPDALKAWPADDGKRLLEKELGILRAAEDLSADIFFSKEIAGRYVACNKRFESFIGCSEQEILGKKDSQLFQQQQALRTHEQNKIFRGANFLINRNEQRHFIKMKKVPVLDKNGKLQGLIGIGRDITARHRMQTRLKIADTVFENSKECIIVTDDMGNIMSVNKACCSTSGFSESELLQLNIRAFPSSKYEQSFYDKIKMSVKEKRSWQGDVTYSAKKGDTHFAWLEIYAVEHTGDLTLHVYSFTDLSQSKSIEEKIQFLSKHDPLTGLFNRIALFSRLEDAIARANHKEVPMAVVLVDINGFKKINDQYQHNAGDKVLKEIAQRLKDCVFAKDTVARFGDDEFVIVVDELANEQDAAVVAQKIATQFNKKILIGNIETKLSATIGISVSPDDGIDGDTLLANAEKALQRGKKDKSALYHFYTPALTRHSNLQLELEKELKNAIASDQFELYYQLQFDLNKRQISGVESTLRWDHPEQGILLPSRFLSLAEETGLIIPLGLTMLNKAAQQAVSWQQAAVNFGRISVPISSLQLSQSSFIADLLSVLKDTDCAAQWLEFEVKEADFRSDVTLIHDNLHNISKLGIALTLDEFGAEPSLLYAIEHFCIEKIKISKHLRQGVPGSLIPDALIKGVLVLARELGLDVIGENIENAQQTVLSTSSHIESGPGDFGVKAMKASEATFYLRCNKRGY